VFLLSAAYAVTVISHRIDETGQSIAVSVAAVSQTVGQMQVNVRSASEQLATVATSVHDTSTAISSAVRTQSGNLAGTVEHANAALDSVPAVSGQLTATLKQAQDSEAQISDTVAQIRLDTLPTLTSIQKASADVPGLVRDSRFAVARIARTAGSVEQASAAIAKETPATAAAVRSVAEDVQKVTDNFVKPKPWWKRVGGVLATLAGLSRYAR
jgi:ABC-type transporter Mla subunit MlaD